MQKKEPCAAGGLQVWCKLCSGLFFWFYLVDLPASTCLVYLALAARTTSAWRSGGLHRQEKEYARQGTQLD